MSGRSFYYASPCMSLSVNSILVCARYVCQQWQDVTESERKREWVRERGRQSDNVKRKKVEVRVWENN